jgi:NAD(P)-dependent dehydrogenase (short-subunit alcohol dehydrogenase family)
VTGRRFHNTRVIVTGAGRGLGFAVARGFAEEGARIVLTDVDDQAAKVRATTIESIGAEAFGLGMDVTREDSVAAGVDEAAHLLGGLDVLINNAGICSTEPLGELTLETWNRILAVNLTGAFLCSRAAQPHLAAGGGKIVNIGSLAGRMGGIMVSAAYSASKAGLAGLTKALAKQLASDGIQANCVAPSTLNTEMTAGFDAGGLEDVRSRIPAGRLGEVTDVVPVVLFLASGDSDYLTGTTLDVNGGLYIAP